ncbi:MAG: sulfate respiration complex iron-sulfur protein HmcF, partial [Thermodesulfobacteriota bacterium]
MPELQLCKPQPIDSKKDLDALLADTGGRQYYEEMKHLPVDTAKLKASLDKTCKSRIRTWL